MPTVVASWGRYDDDLHVRELSDPEEAADLCTMVAGEVDQEPVIIGFTSTDGHFLGIGVGGDLAAVAYWESEDPPYFESVGQLRLEPVAYSFEGHHTELAGDTHVPLEDALEAVRQFVRTGDRPTAVDWRET